VAVTVPAAGAEEARARMLDLVPEGFEEVDGGATVELAGYVGRGAEARIRATFPDAVSEPIADDWPDRWRSFHRPVRVGPVWVGPPWEPAPNDAIAIVIDPGRAFGTGAHPSTRLALELLLEVDPAPLIDIGCGSGVLAIAAAKLGFAVVEAVDVDPVAAEAAAVNAARNGVDFPIRTADALAAPLPAAPLALVNIALDVVEQLAPRLGAETVIASGYLKTQRPELAGLRHARRRTADGWAADLYRRH
jgi:ribosomal protein L11 methyltransferase